MQDKTHNYTTQKEDAERRGKTRRRKGEKSDRSLVTFGNEAGDLNNDRVAGEMMLTGQLQLRRMQRAWLRKGRVVRMLVGLVGRNRIEMEEGIGRVFGG